MENIKDLMVGRSDLYRVDPKDLHVEQSFNARDFTKADTQEHVRRLAAKIKENGFDLSKPIMAKHIDGKLYIRDGECRHRAVMSPIKAGVEIESVPAVVVRSKNVDDFVFMLNGNDGKKLDVFEEADAFKRLVSFGLTPDAIATRIGKPTSYVKERLVQGEADHEVRQLVREKALPLSAPKNIVRAFAEKKATIVAQAKAAKSNGKKVALKDAKRATNGHADYIAYGAVKRLYESLNTRLARTPGDEALRQQLAGVMMVLELA